MAGKRQKRRRWPRRLLLIALVVLAGVWFFQDQQNHIQTEALSVTDPHLPEAFEGFRIVQLSDLHGKQFGAGNEKLLERVAAQEPDLIVLTGDLIDRAFQLEDLPALARGLADIAPTYYVAGNHEWGIRQAKEVKLVLERNGVTPLSNEFVRLERDGQSIVLAGADDPNGPYDQKTGPELREEIAAAAGDVYTILLAHRDAVEEYGGWGYDLVFCGHGHGGIFRIPIVDKGLLSTDRTFFPEYDGGLYPLSGGGYCVVSRGLGSNTVPFRAFRLFNRPHLPVVTLHRGAAPAEG